MSSRWCGSLKDDELIARLGAAAMRDRATTAELLAMIGEVEERRLYADRACDSMYRYCVRVLRMSEDVAAKRLGVARAARRFPVILKCIADGRLTVSGVKLLLPHLTEVNAAGLLEAASGKTNKQIDRLIAQRFPKPDEPTVIWRVETVGVPSPDPVVMARDIPLHDEGASDVATASGTPLAPASGCNAVVKAANSTEPLAARPVAPPIPAQPAHSLGLLSGSAKVTPLSAERFVIQVTVSQVTHDKLREAQDLLGHVVPSGDVAEVLDRALDALIEKQNKQKYAAAPKPNATRRDATDPRSIPARVRRAVRARDGGQCTFEDSAGVRCESRRQVEFHHIRNKACGGEQTEENLCLRCRTHNQRQAEKDYGTEFMREKRATSRRRGAKRAAQGRRAPDDASAPTPPPAPASPGEYDARAKAQQAELFDRLLALGITPGDARWAAATCERIAHAPIEERVRAAIESLRESEEALHGARSRIV